MRNRNSHSDQVYSDERRDVRGDVHCEDPAYRDSEDTPARTRRAQRPEPRPTRAPAARPAATRAPHNTTPARSARSPRPARTPNPLLRSLAAHLVGVVAGLSLVGYSYEHPGFLLPEDERPGASATATR